MRKYDPLRDGKKIPICQGYRWYRASLRSRMGNPPVQHVHGLARIFVRCWLMARSKSNVGVLEPCYRLWKTNQAVMLAVHPSCPTAIPAKHWHHTRTRSYRHAGPDMSPGERSRTCMFLPTLKGRCTFVQRNLAASPILASEGSGSPNDFWASSSGRSQAA